MMQLVVITGASRGFGRAVAESVARATRTATHFILVGRDAAELAETRGIVESSRPGQETVVDVLVMDLGKMDGLQSAADAMFPAVLARAYDKVVFINNAGSLGPLAAIGGYPGDTLADMMSAFNLNVTSACFLTSTLMERCAPGGAFSQQGIKKAVIVNVSSLAAVQAFGSWGIYCAGKAAREMFHKCLTEELGKRGADSLPRVRVLNYAPGPLDTNMQAEIREGPSVDRETQEFYRGLKEGNQLVDPQVSARKLVKLILFEKYESGQHVDFYDTIEGIDTAPGPTNCCACKQCECGVDCACKEMGLPQCAACGL